ncbi:hypothetical protein KY386_01405 [Candidatus Parcubacteria bacterium]|nr:hypothetical protein [Candidatus Parcubacteria bacterium]
MNLTRLSRGVKPPLIIGLAVVVLAVVVGAILAVSSKTGSPPNQNDPAPAAPQSSQSATITGTEAVELIRNCRVKSVVQSHSRQVGLTLDDGSGRRVVEPELDQVMAAVQASENRCGPIMIVTE